MSDNQVPSAVIAERAVLGAILLEPEAYYEVSEKLQCTDFYHVFHQIVYRAIDSLFSKDKPVDLLTLEQEIKEINDKRINGNDIFGLLGEIQESTPTAQNVLSYIEVVKDASLKRGAVVIGTELVSLSRGNEVPILDLIDDTAQKLTVLTQDNASNDNMLDVKTALDSAVTKIEANINNPNKDGLTGLSSGFADLDKMTTGFQDGDLIIVAGRPSMGKTTYSLNLVEHGMWATDLPVIVFSVEMPSDQMMLKMIASIGGVDFQKLRTADLDDEDWARISLAIGKLNEKGTFFIDDTSGISPAEMRSKVRKIYRQFGGMGLIMVDYLQLMKDPKFAGQNDRTNEIAEISRSLKALAKEMDCPVIALSQLNRSLEQRTDKRPINSDLRESGGIEQDADLIMFVYRDEVYYPDSEYKGQAEIIIGKQRNGPIGTVRLTTQLQMSRFQSFTGNTDYV